MTIEKVNALREKFKGCKYKMLGVKEYTGVDGNVFYMEVLANKDCEDCYSPVALINYKSKTIYSMYGYYRPNPVDKSLEQIAKRVGFKYSK